MTKTQKSSSVEKRVNLDNVEEPISFRNTVARKGALFSRSVGLVDLRLTRPPESLKPRELSRSLDFQVTDNDSVPASQPTGAVRVSTPEKRKRKKLETLGIIDDETHKQSIRSKDLFSDLSPEARVRLHGMLTNFCGSEDGIFKDDINLHQFGIDCGEVITNAIVQELCSLQPTLTSLDISYSESVTDVGLWAIARHCTNMKILNLKGCTQITNIGLRSLSLRCSELVSLDFTNCSKLDDIGLSTVAGGCWKLERLILRNCVCISDTGVGRVSRACNRLKVLDLHGCVMVGEFGDHALKDIGAFCTDLRELDMTECKHVQDAGLRAVAVGCPLLRVLRLSGCDGVTGAGLRALSKHCRNLEELAIRGAKYLTDPELELLKGDVLSNCLKVLDLGGCVRVTDKGITTLCHSLGQKLLALNLAESCATDMSSKVGG